MAYAGINSGPATERVREVFSVFDSRLDGEGPLGVAVSGGGDSVALLYALSLWGKRSLEVFCVDHGLNPLSQTWTCGVGELAHRLGAGFTALKWNGEKPEIGISAAARAARHALLAQAARAKNIRVLCLAHTYDDLMEAEVMRQAGSNVGDPRSWSPSPAWPEGRGLWICRPFLSARRADLRNFLGEQQASWIEDPANSNPQSLRARARLDLEEVNGRPPLCSPATPLISRQQMALICKAGPWTSLGQITVQSAPFFELDRSAGLKLLAAAAVCVGGGNRLPRTKALENLYNNLVAGRSHTLCGARVTCSVDQIVFIREAGEYRRHPPEFVKESLGNETIWDGRFSVSGAKEREIRPVTGLKSRLSGADQALLAALPVRLRSCLPVSMKNDEPHLILPSEFISPNLTTIAVLANPSLRQKLYPSKEVRCWVWPRFVSSLGLIQRESEVVSSDFMSV